MHCSGSCRDQGTSPFTIANLQAKSLWHKLNFARGTLHIRFMEKMLQHVPISRCFLSLFNFLGFLWQLISKLSNLQPFYLEYSTGEKPWICVLYGVAYADTGWAAVTKCLQLWLVGLAANQLLQVWAPEPCVDPSPVLTPAPCFHACKMEQGSCDSSWCQCSVHTFSPLPVPCLCWRHRAEIQQTP